MSLLKTVMLYNRQKNNLSARLLFKYTILYIGMVKKYKSFQTSCHTTRSTVYYTKIWNFQAAFDTHIIGTFLK